jgi:hypothetical protein
MTLTIKLLWLQHPANIKPVSVNFISSNELVIVQENISDELERRGPEYFDSTGHEDQADG